MALERTLRRFDVEGKTVRLCHVGDHFVLDSADTQITLTLDEATELLNLRPALFKNLDYLGLDVGQGVIGAPPFHNREALVRQFPEDELLVLVDTTTLMGAHLCLSGATVSPLCFLELSTLTFSLLCFDRVVVQPSFVASLPSMPENFDAILPLKYPPDFIPQTLWSFCADLYPRPDSKVDVTEYAQAWATALRVDEVHLDLHAYDRYQNSPFAWNGVFAHAYMDDLFSAATSQSTVESTQARNTLLSIQTMRTLFNDRLAGYLQLPYLASAVRAPIQAILLRRKGERQLLLDRLFSALGPPTAGQDENDLKPYAAEISAPFLLGLVLEQMKTPSDYWPVIQRYREQFAPLRKRILLERRDWEGRPGSYLRNLLKPLAEMDQRYTRSIEASAVVAGAVATAIRPDVAAAGAGVKLARLAFPTDRVRLAYYKRFRPELHLLSTVAQEAQALRSVDDRIHEIWGKAWQPAELETLMRLAAMQPPDFARLRSLT